MNISASDLSNLSKQLRKVSQNMKKEERRILTKSAKPLVEAIRMRAPVGDEPHYRYSTGKLVKAVRAPKGMGNKVATYKPGNLRDAFKILPLRRTRAVIVGPKVDKGGKGGVFGPGTKQDAYYAHMVEFGTLYSVPKPFVRPALSSSQATVLKQLVDNYTKQIQAYNRTA